MAHSKDHRESPGHVLDLNPSIAVQWIGPNVPVE